MNVCVGSCSVIGSRKKNEDALLLDERLNLFAVADGIGGGYHGDIASKMVVERIHRARLDGVSLRKGFELAQAELLTYSRKHIGDALMGTTLTAIELKPGGIQLVHVGDSRAYQMSDTILRQLTEDHESFEESLQNPVLSEYLGMPDELVPLKIQSEWLPISGRHRFLLSTDGLHRQLDDREVSAITVKAGFVPLAVAEALCRVASQKEESDNVTVIFLEVEF